VNINDSSEKKNLKKTATTVGELITAECASVAYVCTSCTQLAGRLEYNYRIVGPEGWDGRDSDTKTTKY